MRWKVYPQENKCLYKCRRCGHEEEAELPITEESNIEESFEE